MAEILITLHVDPVTQGVWYTYEWQGGLSEEVKIDISCAHHIPCMPFPLENKYPNSSWPRSIYFRTDTAIPWYAYHRFMADCESLYRFWVGVQSKIILTLIIWGIGSISPGEIVQWRHLARKR